MVFMLLNMFIIMIVNLLLNLSLLIKQQKNFFKGKIQKGQKKYGGLSEELPFYSHVYF